MTSYKNKYRFIKRFTTIKHDLRRSETFFNNLPPAKKAEITYYYNLLKKHINTNHVYNYKPRSKEGRAAAKKASGITRDGKLKIYPLRGVQPNDTLRRRGKKFITKNRTGNILISRYYFNNEEKELLASGNELDQRDVLENALQSLSNKQKIRFIIGNFETANVGDANLNADPVDELIDIYNAFQGLYESGDAINGLAGFTFKNQKNYTEYLKRAKEAREKRKKRNAKKNRGD